MKLNAVIESSPCAFGYRFFIAGRREPELDKAVVAVDGTVTGSQESATNHEVR
jgi:hypothetical protein